MYSPKILIIAYALTLTGCVSLAPEYQRPNLNLPHQFNSHVSDAAKQAQTELLIPSWEQFIQDPQMKSVIEIALEKNSDLYLAALDVEEARVRFGLAGAEKYPQVNSSMSGDYSQSLESGSSFNKKYSVGIDISYELDFLGVSKIYLM